MKMYNKLESMTIRDVIVRISITILLAELLIMGLLEVLPFEFSGYVEALIDATLLVVMSSPVIYLFVIKPFINEKTEAQKSLVESAKMASLGRLVAGVAHEINTPIGVSVTAASHLRKKYNEFLTLYKENAVNQESFDKFLNVNEKSTSIILNNLERAAGLISSFKSMAVDQSSNDIREINLDQYIKSAVFALEPKLRKFHHIVEVNAPNIVINIAAGAISQVLTNLIENAIIHAFSEVDDGKIIINARAIDDSLELVYIDNGKGMDEDTADKFFDPFFTTQRSNGGSGLGTHLIYNLVTQSLNGTITLKTNLNEGVEIAMSIPLKENTYV
ncbi:HAMP domain-containing histidine kinase [Sulfurimonas sp.]|nr:HAMP domain-containing histidine kinase [Sulfurimonas sp.]